MFHQLTEQALLLNQETLRPGVRRIPGDLYLKSALLEGTPNH